MIRYFLTATTVALVFAVPAEAKKVRDLVPVEKLFHADAVAIVSTEPRHAREVVEEIAVRDHHAPRRRCGS